MKRVARRLSAVLLLLGFAAAAYLPIWVGPRPLSSPILTDLRGHPIHDPPALGHLGTKKPADP